MYKPFCKKGDKCTWHKGQHKRQDEGESEHDEEEGEYEYDEEQRESREHDRDTFWPERWREQASDISQAKS